MFACVCFAGFAFADDNPTGAFYAKDQVKGFFSVKAEYQQLSGSAINAINHLAFGYGWSKLSISKDTAGTYDTTAILDSRLLHFNQFGKGLLGLGLEFGGQYHQLTTWLDVSFMPTQVSPVPAAYKGSMMDVSWYRYGVDLMVGYQILPETSPINLIPSIGGGINVINLHFADQYAISYPSASDVQMETYSLGRKYYSSFGKDVNAQIEVRLNLGGGVSIGGYGGYKFVWYDEMLAENTSSTRYIINASSEPGGDAWYVGGKVTYTLPSIFETKQKEKF